MCVPMSFIMKFPVDKLNFKALAKFGGLATLLLFLSIGFYFVACMRKAEGDLNAIYSPGGHYNLIF